jgi:tetratricopeptide (TPR) repeat protein
MTENQTGGEMTNNSLTQHSLGGAVILLSLSLMQPSPFAAAAYAAEAAGRMQTAQPSNSAVPAASGETGDGTVLVFDNTLLDKIFTHDRAAAQQIRKRDEAAPKESAERIPLPALLLPSDSFAAKINTRTPASLAAALRFAEQGRRQISFRQYHKALGYFERAAGVGLRNYLPYIYYYLAQTHHYLANYQSAFNFLEVAESWLGDHADWMTSIAALRQENTNAMGYAQAPAQLKTR